MSHALVASDNAYLIVAFLLVSLSVYLLLRSMRSNHARRKEELEQAEFFLSEHFDCAERVINDPATPDVIRNNITMFSMSVGRRDFAQAVARLIRADNKNDKPPTLNQIRKIRDLRESIKELEYHRPDLVQDFAVSVNSGLAAMLLRWPETGSLALQVVSKRVEAVRSAREQSEKFILSVPDDCDFGSPGAIAA